MRKVYCDSSTTQACVVFEGEEPEIISYETPKTNNEGEYTAVRLALERLLPRGRGGWVIYSDSQLVVNQVKGFFKCQNKRLLPYRDCVRFYLTALDVELKWIPREENLAGKVLE